MHLSVVCSICAHFDIYNTYAHTVITRSIEKDPIGDAPDASTRKSLPPATSLLADNKIGGKEKKFSGNSHSREQSEKRFQAILVSLIVKDKKKESGRAIFQRYVTGGTKERISCASST